ncbi:calcium-dependent phosphotriesterase [Aaosphaeria arxii CBS 175.79]|uniref:Calcium-dependent phosphotriesterase n=1 Tax=Aaosphaeria arxii CBS 175.79 TaxID=1450172 RepID=A0A6A5XM94_9PLEO|nr:calcium-dependent phosphotriesterase [Aaosphaeria arxii CBS 175.79]KAF2014026.1 calcium-dependent phosphotriesterase [Aaosphaeria arxii CBS 175.79]
MRFPIEILSLSTLVPALSIRPRTYSQLPLPSRLVYQFEENNNWIENIAVRSNGDLLLSMLTSPDVYLLSGPQTDSPKLTLLHHFDTLTGLLGITEAQPDDFIVVGGNFSGIGVAIPRTSSVWLMSLGRVSKVVDIPEIDFANGMAALPWNRDIVLVSDSSNGQIFRLDTKKGTYEVVIDIPEMHVTPDAKLPIGVNGVRIKGHTLYWSNSARKTLFKARLDESGAIASGAKVETIATLDVAFIDDISVDEYDNIWAVTNLDNRLIVVTPDGKSTVVEGAVDSLAVAGDTASSFGRTPEDSEILYVVTGGGLGAPVNGTITEPGKVVAVDTKGFFL